MTFTGNNFGFDWTHEPSKEDVERGFMQPYSYRWTAKRRWLCWMRKAGTGTEVVYCRNRRIFEELIAAWNALGNTPAKLTGIAWSYEAI